MALKEVAIADRHCDKAFLFYIYITSFNPFKCHLKNNLLKFTQLVCSETSMSIEITWELYKGDLDSVDLKWGLRTCISNKLPGDANAIGSILLSSDHTSE